MKVQLETSQKTSTTHKISTDMIEIFNLKILNFITAIYPKYNKVFSFSCIHPNLFAATVTERTYSI